MRLVAQILLLVFLLFSIGCENNPSEPESVTTDSIFKLNFINGFCSEEGWVILYSEDGKTIKSVRSFYGDAVIDFGEITDTKVTFTYIYTHEYNSRKYYYFVSFYSAPKGEWVLDGHNYSYKGNINVNLTFPQGNYDEMDLSTEGSTIRLDVSNNNINNYNVSDKVYYLNAEQKLSLYGAIINFTTDSAYYDWMPNQTFTIGSTNTYTLNAFTPLSPSFITANRPLKYISIYAAPFNTNYRIKLFSKDYSPAQQYKVFYPRDFSAKKFGTYVSYWENNYHYSFSKIGNVVYSNLDIPTSSITANYNDSQNAFENISVTGTADIIEGHWRYFNTDDGMYFLWFVNCNIQDSIVSRPNIPFEVISQISNFNINDLSPYDISILDYDTALSYEDLINILYKNSENIYETVNEYYIYRYRLNQ